VSFVADGLIDLASFCDALAGTVGIPVKLQEAAKRVKEAVESVVRSQGFRPKSKVGRSRCREDIHLVSAVDSVSTCALFPEEAVKALLCFTDIPARNSRRLQAGITFFVNSMC